MLLETPEGGATSSAHLTSIDGMSNMDICQADLLLASSPHSLTIVWQFGGVKGVLTVFKYAPPSSHGCSTPVSGSQGSESLG